MTKITFVPLKVEHFPLLLKWLETPHVKRWWDQNIVWTSELIDKKYFNYVNGLISNEKGNYYPINAYIILCNNVEIGYTQFYNAYHFARSCSLTNLPKSLAAFDIYIGEPKYLTKGIGSEAIIKLLNENIKPNFQYCFVDPDVNNLAAIKTYEKVGFYKLKEILIYDEIWMLKTL